MFPPYPPPRPPPATTTTAPFARAAVLETSLRVVQADPDHKSGFGIEAPTGVLLARSVQTQMAALQAQYNDAMRTADELKVRLCHCATCCFVVKAQSQWRGGICRPGTHDHSGAGSLL
jgi:hypothetical protein